MSRVEKERMTPNLNQRYASMNNIEERPYAIKRKSQDNSQLKAKKSFYYLFKHQ